jgi:hypothetical protein
MPEFLNPMQSRAVAGCGLLMLFLFCQQFTVQLYGQETATIAFDSLAISGSKAYEWLELSTRTIGHRLTGSEGGRKAEEFADSLFRTTGADTVYHHRFSAQAWSRKSVSLTIGARRVEAVSLANTPIKASISAQLIDAGNGLPSDLERSGGALKGRIAVVNIGLLNAPDGTRNLHRSEKTSLAIGAGAAGIIFINQAEGHVLLTGTASIDGSLIAIPAVCISAEEGAFIREQLNASDVEAKIEMENRSEMIEARNVIAEITGSTLPNEVILIGGHLDSWDLATGATDNGLGSFSIIDICRALKAAGIKPHRTIRFVLFMGEEQGLLGSRALVDYYSRIGELQKIKCMINLDMSGNPSGFGIGGYEGWRSVIEEACVSVKGSLRSARDSSNFKGDVSEKIWLHSDHQPFLLKGVPIIYPLSDLGKHVYGCYHSSCDDIHLVDPKAMVNNVRTVGPLLIHLANAAELPAHFSEDVLKARLMKEDLEEPLRIGGDWPW